MTSSALGEWSCLRRLAQLLARTTSLLLCRNVLQQLPNEKILKSIKNNLTRAKSKWAIRTTARGRDHDIFAGEPRRIHLGAAPFEVEGLSTSPSNSLAHLKVAHLLDLSR